MLASLWLLDRTAAPMSQLLQHSFEGFRRFLCAPGTSLRHAWDKVRMRRWTETGHRSDRLSTCSTRCWVTGRWCPRPSWYRCSITAPSAGAPVIR